MLKGEGEGSNQEGIRMKTDLNFVLRDIYLGIKEDADLSKDHHQSLVIDDFEVKTCENNMVCILINKHHIHEWAVGYCVDCLREGIRNKDAPYGYFSKTESWNRCKNHFAQHIRTVEPLRKCPKCEVGCLVSCGIEGENECCTHCGYSKNVRSPFFPSIMGISQGMTENPQKESAEK